MKKKNKKKKKSGFPFNESMMQKILQTNCGRREEGEFAEDGLGIGDPQYFSTCEYKMIDEDEDAFNCQGS